jgi:TonB family protein
MRKLWLASCGLAVVLGVSLPATLFGQNDSGRETYDGGPVYRVGHGVTIPRATYQPGPAYDEEDRKKKVSGTVVLSMIVTKEGRTADIKVTKSLTPGLDAQSIKAVSQWRFDPATKDGEPVAVRLAVETSFNIR